MMPSFAIRQAANQPPSGRGVVDKNKEEMELKPCSPGCSTVIGSNPLLQLADLTCPELIFTSAFN